MKKIKKTKIIATIGPSSSSSKTMEQMMLGGVDVFRINFSHAKHNEVKKTIKLIREIDKKLSLNTAIIADLQGVHKSNESPGKHISAPGRDVD